MVTLSQQVTFFLNQCNSKVEKSGGQTMSKALENLFCMISTKQTYSGTLQLCFWNIET